MSLIDRLFLDHPRDVRESYGEHALVAARFGMAMIGGGLACLVHGLVPALFTRTGSDTVNRLHAGMIRRASASAPRDVAPAAFAYEI